MRRISLFIGLALPALALAEQVPLHSQALIEDSGRSYQGVLSINQAAGDQHQQINARALAIGSGASATTNLRQQQVLENPDLSRNMQSSIEGNAFSNGNGVLGVNQSSGAGSQQINSFRTSVGAPVESLDDSILAQQSVVLSQDSGAAESGPGARIVGTDDRAFAGSSGVVQLSQSAGVGNRTVNSLSIRVMD